VGYGENFDRPWHGVIKIEHFTGWTFQSVFSTLFYCHCTTQIDKNRTLYNSIWAGRITRVIDTFSRTFCMDVEGRNTRLQTHI